MGGSGGRQELDKSELEVKRLFAILFGRFGIARIAALTELGLPRRKFAHQRKKVRAPFFSPD
jgi:hypothetical protein